MRVNVIHRRWTGFSCSLYAIALLTASCAVHNAPVDNKKVADADVKTERSGQDAEPLIASIKNKDINALRQQLASGANPDSKDSTGFTPLMIASLRGEKEMAELLLQAGANINDTDDVNETSLVKAINAGEAEVVELLIEKGADTQIKGPPPVGDTALHVAARGLASKRIMEALLSRSPDINIQNAEGETPLIVAAANNKEAFRALIDKGADINLRNKGGMTPLMVSVGSAEEMKILLDHGADVNAKDADGWTALEIALLKGCPDIIDLLEKAGARE